MSRNIKQYNIFGEDITEEMTEAERKRRRSEAAKTGWETRRTKEEQERAEYDRMFNMRVVPRTVTCSVMYRHRRNVRRQRNTSELT